MMPSQAICNQLKEANKQQSLTLVKALCDEKRKTFLMEI